MILDLRESEKSRADLEDIWAYIAFGNPISGDPVAADHVIDAVARTYQHLRDYPHKSRIKGSDIFRTAVMDFSQYVILFRFDEKVAEILRVFRADLDWLRVIDENGF